MRKEYIQPAVLVSTYINPASVLCTSGGPTPPPTPYVPPGGNPWEEGI